MTPRRDTDFSLTTGDTDSFQRDLYWRLTWYSDVRARGCVWRNKFLDARCVECTRGATAVC